MHIDYYNNDDRNLLLPLFALADDSRAQIATYITRGEVLVARDGDLIVGHLQILDRGCQCIRAQEHGGYGKTSARGYQTAPGQSSHRVLPRTQQPSVDRLDRNCRYRQLAFLSTAGLSNVQNCT